MVATSILDHSSGISSGGIGISDNMMTSGSNTVGGRENNNFENEEDTSAACSISSFPQSAFVDLDFDSMTEEQVRVQAIKLSEKYKLLLRECDIEASSVKELRKRVKNLETEKVSFSSKYTDEICELLSENTVLKSKLERIEAGKQNQDLHTVSKIQSMNADLSAKEEQLTIVNNALNNLRSEFNAEVASKKDAQHQLEMLKKEFTDRSEALANKLDCIVSENKSMKMENNALTQKVAEQNNLVQSLEDKISDLMKDNGAVEADWKHTKDEFETFVVCADEKRAELIARTEDLENQLMKEINEKNRMTDKTEKITNQLTDLIRSYENSKHDNEQLAKEVQRVHDDKSRSEASLKSLNGENEELKGQLSDYEQNFQSIRIELEQALKRQKIFESTYSDSFKNLEHVLFQHSTHQQQSGAKSTKGNSGGGMTNPVGGRRTHERAEARNKRSRSSTANDPPTKDNEDVTECEPYLIVDSVASMLQHYNSQVETGRAENTALVDRLKAVSTEVESYKEAVEHSKRVLDELKEQLATKTHEAAKLKRENCELTQKVSSSSQEARENLEAHEKQRSRADKLSDQMLVYKKKAKLEEETKKKQLLSVGVKLASLRSLNIESSETPRGTNSAVGLGMDPNVTEFSEWELIVNNVMEQLDAYTLAYKTLIDKARKFEFACMRKDEALDELSSSHEAELSSLKGKLAHQTQTHNNHKMQLEEHYQLMVEDLKQKLKDNQKWASENTDKIALLENLRTSQEIEIGELKELLVKSQHNAQSFQLALCLLSSVLWPTFERMNALIAQQHMLHHYFTESEQTAHQIARLVSALNNELAHHEDRESTNLKEINRRNLPPILKLRRCVIAVLAANRLMRISNESTLCFTVDDHLVGGPNSRLSVYIGQCSANSNSGGNAEPFQGGPGDMTGNLKKQKKGSKSRKSQISHQTVALRDAKEKIQSHQLLMLNWLTDNGFSYKVMTSLNDLLAFVQKNAVDSDGNQKQLKGILTQTRNSFVQLISRLSQQFESCSPLVESGAVMGRVERSSLSQRLLRGLHSTMMKMSPAQRAVYVPLQHNLAAVQTKMIELCEKIAAFEDEKAALSREVINLRSENGHLATVRDRANILQEKLDALKTQSENMVSREKYTKTCGELDSAMLREKQAEDLLKEQGDQLLNMGRQLESKHKEENSREISLAESARELCEVKLELSKKTHEMRGLSRKMEELQLEKSRLQQSVTNADISARCAVRDGDMVSCYVKAVNDAVEGFKNQLIYSPSTANALMLPQLDEVVSGGTKFSNELKMCHELVINFGDTLGHLTTHLHNQTNQIRTQKENIAALKQELLASTKPPLHHSVSSGRDSAREKSGIESGLGSRSHMIQSSASFSNPKQMRQRQQTPDSDYGGSHTFEHHLNSGLLSSSSTLAPESPLMFHSLNTHQQAPQNSATSFQGDQITSSHSMFEPPRPFNLRGALPRSPSEDVNANIGRKTKESGTTKRSSTGIESQGLQRRNSQTNRTSASSLSKMNGNQRSPARNSFARR